MTLIVCKVVAVMFCMQLLARSASAQATAFAAAGDVSALAAAGGGSALAAAGSTAGYNPIYVQPIFTAFTSSKAWDAANAVAVALQNNQAASILQAVSQVTTSACNYTLTSPHLRLNVFHCCRPRFQTCSLWWCVTATTTG